MYIVPLVLLAPARSARASRNALAQPKAIAFSLAMPTMSAWYPVRTGRAGALAAEGFLAGEDRVRVPRNHLLFVGQDDPDLGRSAGAADLALAAAAVGGDEVGTEPFAARDHL